MTYIYIFILPPTQATGKSLNGPEAKDVWVILMFLIYLSSYPQMKRINQLLNRTLIYIFREKESVAVVLRSDDDNGQENVNDNDDDYNDPDSDRFCTINEELNN